MSSKTVVRLAITIVSILLFIFFYTIGVRERFAGMGFYLFTGILTFAYPWLIFRCKIL